MSCKSTIFRWSNIGKANIIIACNSLCIYTQTHTLIFNGDFLFEIANIIIISLHYAWAGKIWQKVPELVFKQTDRKCIYFSRYKIKILQFAWASIKKRCSKKRFLLRANRFLEYRAKFQLKENYPMNYPIYNVWIEERKIICGTVKKYFLVVFYVNW